jgi:tetratricopeptide (TPR) repeat protein
MSKRFFLSSLAVIIFIGADVAWCLDVPIVDSETLEFEREDLGLTAQAATPAPEATPAVEEPQTTQTQTAPVETAPAADTILMEHARLKEQYDLLMQERDTLLKEKDSLRGQKNELLQIKELYKQALGDLEIAKQENTLLRYANSESTQKDSALTTRVAQLEEENARLALEAKDALALTQKSGQMDKISYLQEQLAFSQKTKADLVEVMKTLEAQLKELQEKEGNFKVALAQRDDAITRLKMQYGGLEQEAKELVTENNSLKTKVEKIPQEFAGLAHENKKLKKQTADMHYNLGVFYTQQKEFKRAGMEFLKAIELRPDDASAHYNLGYIFAEHLMDESKAVEHFKEYLRISKGKDKDADKAKKYILIWETYDQKVNKE